MSLHSRLEDFAGHLSPDHSSTGPATTAEIPEDYAEIRLFGTFTDGTVEEIRMLLPEANVSLMTGSIIIQRGATVTPPAVLSQIAARLLSLAEIVVIHTSDARFSRLESLPAAIPGHAAAIRHPLDRLLHAVGISL